MRDVHLWNELVFAEDPTAVVMRDAASNAGARVPLLNWKVMKRDAHTFSHEVQPRMKASDQQRSGRCWGFAGLSMLRRALAKRRNMDDDAFELSQTHLMFYDKLERAHAFLVRAREMRECDDEDRYLHHLLRDPMSDGGTWHTFVALVLKYGVVPASAMPETDPASDSEAMNRLLTTLLLQTARRMRHETAPVDVDEVLRRVHRLLCICMGGPPPTGSFTWSYKAKQTGNDDASPRVVTETTTAFDLYRACELPLEDFVVLAHVPSRTKSMGEAYQIQMLGTVLPEPRLPIFYNVPMEALMDAAYRCLCANVAVHFACEFDFMRLAGDGLLHHELVHYERAIGEGLESRECRVDAKSIAVDHAMLFTGCHVEDGKVVRWQVENSHGDYRKAGYLSMSTGWFDNHVFCVAVPKEYAPQAVLRAPIVTLPPWDVIGAVLS